jgi:predicted RND superfamily exporter protein
MIKMWEYLAVLLVTFTINIALYFISAKEQASIFSLLGALFGTVIDLATFGQGIPTDPYIQMFFIIIQWLFVIFQVTR